MKNAKTLAAIATMFAAIATTSCSKNDGPDGPVVTPGQNIDVRGSVKTSQKWTKNNTYRLRGYVYVEDGVTLTIEPGTKIVSNKDSAGVLVIYKGAKIMAQGTATEPIVFTSAEGAANPGDLGGLVLVGKATGNKNHAEIEGGVDAAHKAFGGTEDADNSGVISYVRIEYAGKAVNPGDEINGLSLYAVGSGTTIDHVQVVRGLDDAFEFFGGTVNCKYLIAYNSADDDYDMDDGYRGKIQFAISVKDPKFTDDKGTSGDISNNFEVDNTNGKIPFSTTPITNPNLSNFTAIGPNNAEGTSKDYGYGARLRRGSMVVLANSILLGGQKAGLVVEDAETQQAFIDSKGMFYNSLISSVTDPFMAKTATLLTNASLQTLVTGTYGSVLLTTANDAGLTDPFNNAKPDLRPKAGSKALTTAGKFDKASLADAFFVKTSYVGALDNSASGGQDWNLDKSWAVWGR